MKNYFINIGLLCITIVVFFLAIEFGLRFTGIQGVEPDPPRLYQESDDTQLSYELKPNMEMHAFRSTVTTDENGFRSAPIDPDKPTIAFLGDSITFGYGVEDDETVPAQLGQLLPDYNVVNAAAPGYNLSQQSAMYREKVALLDPSVLVLIFHFNDVGEPETSVLDEDGILRTPGWTPGSEQCDPIERGILGYVPYKCWLDLNSSFYKAVKKYVNQRYASETLEEEREKSREDVTKDEVTDEMVRQYAVRLGKFAQMMPEDLPRLFVIWPDRLMHEPSRPKLQKAAQNSGFVVLDLYDTFGNEAETLGWDTVHPSPNTTKEAAGVINASLNKLLP